MSINKIKASELNMFNTVRFYYIQYMHMKTITTGSRHCCVTVREMK
jgi:hypothetical protein